MPNSCIHGNKSANYFLYSLHSSNFNSQVNAKSTLSQSLHCVLWVQKIAILGHHNNSFLWIRKIRIREKNINSQLMMFFNSVLGKKSKKYFKQFLIYFTFLTVTKSGIYLQNRESIFSRVWLRWFKTPERICKKNYGSEKNYAGYFYVF